jgi:PAS domain S-box-containing protein
MEMAMHRAPEPAASASGQARLDAALEARIARLQTLTHLNRLVLSSLNIGEVLGEIARAAATLMEAPFVIFWIADEGARTLELGAFSDEATGADFPLPKLTFDQSAVGWVATHRRPLHVPDVFSDARVVALNWWHAHDLRSFLGLPVVAEEILLAVLALNGYEPFRFDAEEQELLENFAATAAIALKNARLFAEVQKQTARLATMNAELESEIAERRHLEEARHESEERFRKIFEEGPLGMAIVGMDYRFVKVNATLCRMTGYTEQELTGRSFADITHPEDLAADLELAAKVFNGKLAFYQLEKRYIKKSGEPLWIHLTASVIRDAAGAPLYGLAMVEDITERKQAEEEICRVHEDLEIRVQERTAELARANQILAAEIAERQRAEAALQKSEASMRAIVDAALDCIIAIDHQGRIVEFNPAATETFGYARHEAIGKQLAELIIPPAWRERHYQGMAHYLATGESPILGKRLEMPAIRADGTELLVELAVVPLPWHEQPRFTAYLRDITQRKRAEEALQQTAQELARSNTELEQFAYVASHDLQEPLRMVSGYLQLLQRHYKGRLDTDADEFITYAVDGATRMQRLIHDLLDYSRVGTRQKALRPTDSEQVLARALDNLRLTIAESGAVVTHDPLPTVLADDLQLLQVMQNLLGNALKFRSQQPPQVHVTATRQGTEWVFAVRDNGIGLDPAYAKRIFVIFQRLHSRTEYPGTGIGLAICKKIIERHGGRIWVESAPGKGATFFFTLPTGHP